MDKGIHRGFITHEELGKSLGKRHFSQQNVEAAFLHIFDNKICLVEKKSDYSINKKTAWLIKIQKIAAIRLSLPAADSLEQMIGWPKDLISTLSPKKYFAKGGYEVDGREISPLDEDEINKICINSSKKDLKE